MSEQLPKGKTTTNATGYVYVDMPLCPTCAMIAKVKERLEVLKHYRSTSFRCEEFRAECEIEICILEWVLRQAEETTDDKG